APVVEVRCMAPQRSQRSCPVLARCRSCCVDRVHADFGRVMQRRHVSLWTADDVREVGSLMTGAAARLVAKELLATLRRLLIEAPLHRLRRWETQLIVKQGPKVWGGAVGGLRNRS